jgi:D-alanyl-D-alanine dipeptidase
MPLREIRHPAIDIDLRYATPDNFTGRVIYDHAVAFLHQDALDALLAVAQATQAQGLRVRVLDAYRPQAAQRRLWAVLPDVRFVADPAQGSIHSRGVAVDLTLTTPDSLALDMGTAFDEMTDASAHDYPHLSPQARANRDLLRGLMQAQGWVGHPFEWWHYNLAQPQNYPLLADEVEGRALMDALGGVRPSA